MVKHDNNFIDSVLKLDKDNAEDTIIDDSIKSYDDILFIDLLGFKNILKTVDKEGDIPKHCKFRYPIFIFFERLNIIINKFINDQEMQGDVRYLMISDSIYFFFNSNVKDNICKLTSLIFFYAYLCDLYYRGYVSNRGVLYDSDEPTLYLGQGIIESYIREGKLPIYSRVIVEDSNIFGPNQCIESKNDNFLELNIFKSIEENYSAFLGTIVENYKRNICNQADSCEYNLNHCNCYNKIQKNDVKTFQDFLSYLEKKIDKNIEIYMEKEKPELVQKYQFLKNNLNDMKKEADKYE